MCTDRCLRGDVTGCLLHSRSIREAAAQTVQNVSEKSSCPLHSITGLTRVSAALTLQGWTLHGIKSKWFALQGGKGHQKQSSEVHMTLFLHLLNATDLPETGQSVCDQ